MFEALDSDEVDIVINSMEERRVEAGANVIEQG
jgi:hypothetical protein